MLDNSNRYKRSLDSWYSRFGILIGWWLGQVLLSLFASSNDKVIIANLISGTLMWLLCMLFVPPVTTIKTLEIIPNKIMETKR